LINGPLTPFSYSVLAEIAGRAWYQYFDKLGFAPTPRARVLRQYQGRPYLNLTISAQRDAEGAAVEPLTLRIDGQPFPLCKWETPGLLAGLKASMAQSKIEHYLKTLTAEMDTITQAAAAWYQKTLSLRWVQAETLQIMEEIEHAGARSFAAFLAARHNLDLAYNRLIRLSAGRIAFPTLVSLLDRATLDVGKLTEYQLSAQLAALGASVRRDQAVLAWLQAGDFTQWEQTLPNPTLLSNVAGLLDQYGHRALEEGEIRQARLRQDPAPLFTVLLAMALGQIQPANPQVPDLQPLFNALDSGARKEAHQLVQKVQQLLPLQSRALNALAYILTGTQRWAMAAAKEAMADQRLLSTDDVFFFELEEMKEMMTGEWNISQRKEIQTTCVQRRAEYAQWQQMPPAALLIGESEAQAQPTPLPIPVTLSLHQLLASNDKENL
jgi:hypothetical protein